MNVYEQSLFIGANHIDSNANWKPFAIMQYMQELGTAQCEAVNLGDAWMQENGYFWVLVRMRMAISRSPKVGYIKGETWHQGVYGALWRRDYLLSEGEDTLCRIVAMWAMLNRENHSLLRPQFFPPNFPSAPERSVFLEPPSKLSYSPYPLLLSRVVNYSDIDMNGHANNTRYADWICDAIGHQIMQEYAVSELQIDYRRQVMYGEELNIYGAAMSYGKFDMAWRIKAEVACETCFCAEVVLKKV
jgi:acyl-ACP thioesterase